MNLNHNNNHLHYPYTRLIQRFPSFYVDMGLALVTDFGKSSCYI